MPENFELPPNAEDIEKNLKEGRIKTAIKGMLGLIFDDNADGPERITTLLERLEPFLKSNLIDGEGIKQSLQKLPAIENRDEFIESTFSLLGPFIDLRINNEEEFNRLRPESDELRPEGPELISVNEIFAYGLHEDSANIHLGLSGLSMREVKKLFIEGLKELAKIIEVNKNISIIAGESWVIAQKPGIIEKLGFTVDPKITKRATISREDFLRRYLK